MERLDLGAAATARLLPVDAVAFFFLGALRLLEDPVLAIMESLR
jgi:hypothetical protein